MLTSREGPVAGTKIEFACHYVHLTDAICMCDSLLTTFPWHVPGRYIINTNIAFRGQWINDLQRDCLQWFKMFLLQQNNRTEAVKDMLYFQFSVMYFAPEK
jgi:hypothetical protein